MIKYIYGLLIAGLAVTSTSCKKDLAGINKNPNSAENPQPDYLLTATEKITSDVYWGADNNFNSSLLVIQHWAKIQYTEPDRYIFSNSSFTSLWNTGFAQSINNLNTILQMPAEKANDNYKNVATILRSWIFQLLTDAYGNIPYQQAGDIDQYLTPQYNTQKEVYFGLLDELKTAGAALDQSRGAIVGDIIYGGNIARWKKFANSLRLRIALRIADREPEKASQVINEVLNDAGGLIAHIDEAAKLVYANSPQQNPVSAWFETRDDFRIGKTLVDKLYALNDPRLDAYAAYPRDTSVHQYVGVPSGLTNSDANNLGFAKTSKPDSVFFYSPNAPAVIQSYAEVLFARAEAAARNFTTEDAEALYNEAIKASFRQYNITDVAVINSYLAQASVKYNAGNFKQSIGEQKWIALFGQGLEAFAEWRRLDYPRLTAGVAGVLDGKIPVRFIYPGAEQALNKENYTKAVENQGPDNLLTKLWFDQY